MKRTSSVASSTGLYIAYAQHQARRSFKQDAAKTIYTESRLVVSVSAGIHVLPHADIVYCQAESNYTAIHLADGNRVLISKPLKWVAERLPCQENCGGTTGCFLRVHQTFLVNIAAVRMIETGSAWSCRLSNGQTVPVARARRGEVVALFSP